ncbi:DUF5677 domain-containing protein, partial [Mesorhizobium japonicum]|uniref:DUF5677 domain-containing protein n=1 Tax=Mesorhizobium japonicum TaxID=2066070 RepID=UPI003B5C031A
MAPTKSKSFEALLEVMAPLPEAFETGTYRLRYRRVGHIAHGWMKRCARGIEAVMLLQRSGYAGEAAPLMRSVVEHSVALRWLVAEGPDILPTLMTNHQGGTKRLLDAALALAKGIVDEKHFRKVIESAEHDDHSRDNLQHFAARVDRYGTLQDQIEYFGYMLTSHATFQSAIAYWDQSDETPRPTDANAADYRKQGAVYLYLALKSYSSIFVAPPWSSTLREVRGRIVDLEPGLYKIP